MFGTTGRNPLILAVLIACLVTGLAGEALAIDWVGGPGGDWTVGANWSGGTPPGAADEARFTTNASVSNAPASIANIEVDGATVTITTMAAGGNFTVTGGVASPLGIGDVEAIEVLNGGSLTFQPNVELTTGVLAVVVSSGGSLIVNGTLLVSTLTAHQSESDSTVQYNGGMDLTNQLVFAHQNAAGVTIPITITGNVRFLAANAGLRANTFVTQTFQATDIIEITLDGNLDASSLTGIANNSAALMEMRYARWVIAGQTRVIGGGDNTFASTLGGLAFFGHLTVNAGASFSFTDTAFTTFFANFLNILNNGTVNFGNAPIGLNGTLENADGFIENNGTWTCNGTVQGVRFAFNNGPGGTMNEQKILFRGDLTFGGDATFLILSWLVDQGSTVTFNGNVNAQYHQALDVDGLPILGADEDGATASGRGTITVNGNLTVAANPANPGVTRTNMYGLGEGTHNFGGNVSMSENVDGQVQRPDATNNEAPIVNFTGTTQALSFTAGGSYFLVSSAAANTEITLTGKLILIGDLDTSGATGAGFTAAAGNPVEVGDGTFGVTGTIANGAGTASIDTLIVRETSVGADATEHNTVTFSTTGNGLFTIGTLTIEGDTTATAAGPDQGGGEVIMDSFNGSITTITVGFGTSANEGFGASLTLSNGTTLSLPASTLSVGAGAGVASEPNGGAKLTVNSSTITMADTSTIAFENEAGITMDGATINGGATWSITSVATVASISINASTIGADAANGFSITLSGDAVSVVGSTFSNYDSAGLNIDNATIIALNQNTFTSGQVGGTHITLNSILNGLRLNADSNGFDDSVDTANAGLLVSHTTGSAPLTFRRANDEHGINPFSIDSVTAEANGDNDGTTATEVQWSTAPVTTVTEPGSQPNSSGFLTDGTAYAILAFTVAASNGDSNISEFTFNFAFTGAMTMNDIATLTLYTDVNGNGDYDSGTDTIADANATLTAVIANPAVMTGLTITITGGSSADYVLVATFSNDAGGGLTVTLPANGINAGGNIVNGLPVTNTITGVTGAPATLVITVEPVNGGPARAFVTQPVLELRDANGLVIVSDNTTTVTATVLTGPAATFVGTNPVTAINGVFTFTDLGLDTVGTYTLRFTTTPGSLTADSASVDVTLDGGVGAGGTSLGGGGGGCSAIGGGSHLLPLMLLLMLGLVAIRRRV